MQLIVGTDSTWSLRTWMCAKLANIDVSEQVINLSEHNYKSSIVKYSSAGLVPALLVDGTVIHDSLAIVEYFNEITDGSLYPTPIVERALARSLCAEMHAGFMEARRNFPFTLTSEPVNNGKSEQPFSSAQALNQPIQDELTRIVRIFEQAKGTFMFDRAGAVDAFYAILAFRLHSYGIVFDGKAGEYQRSLLDWSLLNDAINKAVRWKA